VSGDFGALQVRGKEVRNLSKSISAVVLGAALVATALTAPAFAETKKSITVAEVTAGGGGVQQIGTPWVNSGSISHHAMFRALFKANADLMTVKPDLASGYKLSKDGKTVTISMKSGLKWSDGVAITAEDVVWSMNTVLRGAAANAIYTSAFKQIVGGAAVNATNTTTISGLTAKGNEITISLLAPVNIFIPVLAQFTILPKHILADEDLLKLASNNYWKAPVVSGPFKVGTFSQGNFITLVPNDKFEGPKPKLDEINIVVSANLVADAKSGKLDYFTTNDPTTIKAMSSVTTHKLFELKPPSYLFYRYFIFNLNGAENPFKNVKAREALKYGVDWNRIVPAIFPKAGKVINSGIPSGVVSHDASIPRYQYNKAKAIALLKEADFDFSKTIRLRYYNDGLAITFMAAVAQQMTDLGLKVDLMKFQGDATTELYTNRNYDIALKGLSAFNAGEWFAEYSNPNFAKILGVQPEFTALNDKFLQAVKFRDQAKLLASLQKLEQENLYKLPLHSLQQGVFISKRISGTATKWGNPLYTYNNNIANWAVN
jgi:peptide/nickel transport system substrate-binding protein